MSRQRLCQSVWVAVVLLFALAGCVSFSGGTRYAGYDYYSIGDTQLPTPGKLQPGLLLIGGGDWPLDAFQWFFERAGHGHIVILRASMGDANQREMYEEIGGIASAQTFVFKSRQAAYSPHVLEAIRRADGIYLGGGDQSRYVRYWQGTPVEQALNRHVALGKPLGGTSAGLAVQGRYVYGALDGGSLTSRQALADSRSRRITLVTNFLRFEPLYSAGVLTDTHFDERHRQARLMTMMANLRERHPELPVLGLGVDEETALAIDGMGAGRIFTNTGGRAWLFRPGDYALNRRHPVRVDDWHLIGIGRASHLDTRDWRVTDAEFDVTVSIRDAEVEYSADIPPPNKP